MRNAVLLHVADEDPILAEIEGFPNPTDTSVTVFNPRRRDGKPVHYFIRGVNTVILPWHRITFIEVMTSEPSSNGSSDSIREDVVEFFRENQ